MRMPNYQPNLAGREGDLKIDSQIGHACPRIGQNGSAQTNATTLQGADLRFWVELRGFEPLTPSMRTRCATGLRYSPKTGRQRSKSADHSAHQNVGPQAGQSPTARMVASAY
jgi:hypothetical protein